MKNYFEEELLLKKETLKREKEIKERYKWVDDYFKELREKKR